MLAIVHEPNYCETCCKLLEVLCDVLCGAPHRDSRGSGRGLVWLLRKPYSKSHS